MDSCDLNFCNILISRTLRKHVIGDLAPKSTKTALKVNELNAGEGDRIGVRFLVPPTPYSMQHEVDY